MPSFPERLRRLQQRAERALDARLPRADSAPARLHEAMRYVTLDGGKRVRASLVYATGAAVGAPDAALDAPACAVELIHAYSLVHDDLPCMDDDDLRRGKPTCHKRFDEATAILAGDALQALAFEVLAHEGTHGDPAVRTALVAELAKAAGAQGMVGGQMLDLLAETQPDLSIGAITRLQRLKTGALISFSCTAGAILGKAAEPLRVALAAYAHDLGLAFQIVDDLLDVEGDAATLGKATNKDADAGKATFVSILGLERARSQATLLAQQAAAHLEPFGPKADLLKQAAQFVVTRRA